MYRIVSAIHSLKQHLATLASAPEVYRPTRCPHCGIGSLWCHGHYDRKADREEHRTLNPVPIPRFYCHRCRHTCSRLPACVPPRRWYGWALQQRILLLLLVGYSLHAVGQVVRPCRDTCRRWWRWLNARHEWFGFHLRSAFPGLGRTLDGLEFWQACMETLGLEAAMAWLDHHGVNVP
ncbi:hypothetical protein JKG47_17440 [Acidithiobacillus sp. MC6.1]|nr:hypothetical protein [Acidithiobacillus sp. MC6.1]